MSLIQLANIGEFIGGLAVLITLAYLAVQMRQSTDLAQGAAQRDLMNSFQSNLDRVARDPVIWQRGFREFDTMSNQDRVRFQMAFNPFINHLEQTLRMLSRGLETQDNVDIYGDICLSLLQEPGGREVRERNKPLFFPMSREYIERRLGTESTLPPRISVALPWFTPDESST